MTKGIDLFAGAGGTSHGAINAGVDIVWAANHNPVAVEYHALNHPSTAHVCQDLHQADWSAVPQHDLLYASPCCAGHSNASGKAKRTIKADISRSTAWAIISCLEAHKTPIAIIENVGDFLSWALFEPWKFALNKLGYTISINHINAVDLGVPQNRPRLFIVATRSAHPLTIQFDRETHIPARNILDTSFDGHQWDLVSNRVKATQERVANGRKRYGNLFLDAAYGSAKSGRSIDKPLGTITTVNKHSVVIGDFIRPITIAEQARAQSFPDSYKFPESKTLAKKMIGNAVPPMMAEKVTRAILKSA